MIFGTSPNRQQSTKSGPVDRVFVTNICQKIQENDGIILETYYFFISQQLFENPQTPNCLTLTPPYTKLLEICCLIFGMLGHTQLVSPSGLNTKLQNTMVESYICLNTRE